jgi:hypothetical protein
VTNEEKIQRRNGERQYFEVKIDGVSIYKTIHKGAACEYLRSPGFEVHDQFGLLVRTPDLGHPYY